jgi:hypothetical protein
MGGKGMPKIMKGEVLNPGSFKSLLEGPSEVFAVHLIHGTIGKDITILDARHLRLLFQEREYTLIKLYCSLLTVFGLNNAQLLEVIVILIGSVFGEGDQNIEYFI